jgi:hypothetical protein
MIIIVFTTLIQPQKLKLGLENLGDDNKYERTPSKINRLVDHLASENDRLDIFPPDVSK